jgi:hypothetical protein
VASGQDSKDGKDDDGKKGVPRHAGAQIRDEPLEADPPTGPSLNGTSGGKHRR